MPFDKLKRWILGKTPIKPSQGHDKLSLPLHHIGLIAEIDSQEDLDAALAFSKRKTKEGQKVELCLFSSNKALAGDDFIIHKDIKWSGKPTCERTMTFINTPFDILYCGNKHVGLTLEYVIKQADAKFKVGLYSKEMEPYLDLFCDSKHQRLGAILTEIDETLDKLKRRR